MTTFAIILYIRRAGPVLFKCLKSQAAVQRTSPRTCCLLSSLQAIEYTRLRRPE